MRQVVALKAEADTARKIAEHPLPSRKLTRWELTYGSIFLIDVILVLLTLAWRVSATGLLAAAPYYAGAFLVPLAGIVIGVIWAKRRTRVYWRTFDEVDIAIRRYNDIAGALAQHNIILDPPRIALNDPWR